MKRWAGKIIAIEGIDQAGKNTVATFLAEQCLRQDVWYWSLGFPDYETALGRTITEFLSGNRHYPAEVRQLLYAANRYESLVEIQRVLDQQAVVIIDRYLISGVAYGAAQGLDLGWALGIESKLPQPSLTILLDIPPETSAKRKQVGRDAYEQNLDLLAAVRQKYLTLAIDPTWIVVDADTDQDEVKRRVVAALEAYSMPS